MATEDLEKIIKDQQLEIERLQAVVEIQNLMSEYEYLHTANRHKDVMELYAKDPDTRVYMGELGYWKGADAPQRAWQLLESLGGGKPPVGMMAIHPVVSPIIVVAGDGKTAKGVWISPGLETGPYEGKMLACWAWLKYGADFVKEDGKWKFWHLTVFGMFMTPYDKPWTEEASPEGEMELPDELKPDKKTTYWTNYKTADKQELIPVPPEPYETWDESTSYVKPEYLK